MFIRHGMKRRENTSREYIAWLNSRARCNNPKNTMYHRYGGRGIRMMFKNFEEFFEHLGFCPDGMSLDRIDNNGNYEPGNVRWASRHTQMSNRSDNVTIEYCGKTQTIAGWARERNISTACLWARINTYGWPIEKALNTPVMSLKEASKLGTDARWHKSDTQERQLCL